MLTACVKKETPKEEEQDKVETAVSEPQPAKPAKFESLESVDTHQEAQVEAQPQVEVHREETNNTTTEIRRETRPAHSDESSQTQVAEQPKSETPKVEPKPEKKLRLKQNLKLKKLSQNQLKQLNLLRQKMMQWLLQLPLQHQRLRTKRVSDNAQINFLIWALYNIHNKINLISLLLSSKLLCLSFRDNRVSSIQNH